MLHSETDVWHVTHQHPNWAFPFFLGGGVSPSRSSLWRQRCAAYSYDSSLMSHSLLIFSESKKKSYFWQWVAFSHSHDMMSSILPSIFVKWHIIPLQRILCRDGAQYLNREGRSLHSSRGSISITIISILYDIAMSHDSSHQFYIFYTVLVFSYHCCFFTNQWIHAVRTSWNRTENNIYWVLQYRKYSKSYKIKLEH